jgi:hypothetical protein
MTHFRDCSAIRHKCIDACHRGPGGVAAVRFWGEAFRVHDKQPQAKSHVRKTLQPWKTDPDRAGIRDHETLKRLPEDEQKARRAFWAEVGSLLTKSENR